MASGAKLDISNETLCAFVDGELNDAERDWVIRMVVADPGLQGRAWAYRQQVAGLKRLYGAISDEPTPAGLLALLR